MRYYFFLDLVHNAHLISSKLFHGNNDHIYIAMKIDVYFYRSYKLHSDSTPFTRWFCVAFALRMVHPHMHAVIHKHIQTRTIANSLSTAPSPLSRPDRKFICFMSKKYSYFVFVSIVKMLNLLRDYLLRRSGLVVPDIRYDEYVFRCSRCAVKAYVAQTMLD